MTNFTLYRYAASHRGHEKVAELLVSNGAGVNAQGGDYGTTLQAASFGDHEKVVKLLLSNGASVNTQVRWYGTSLCAASFGGHEKIVELLINNRIEATRTWSSCWAAIMAPTRSYASFARPICL